MGNSLFPFDTPVHMFLPPTFPFNNPWKHLREYWKEVGQKTIVKFCLFPLWIYKVLILMNLMVNLKFNGCEWHIIMIVVPTEVISKWQQYGNDSLPYFPFPRSRQRCFLSGSGRQLKSKWHLTRCHFHKVYYIFL